MKSPYPYFGGKSKVAGLVWERFGEVRNFVDPFLGSMAMLLNRPTPFVGTETVNDLDGMVANFWRAIHADPKAVARHASNPVNENDLHARHAWLVARRESLTSRLEGDPDYFDPKVAGWWVWGACCWIGVGWCSGQGPWHVVDGELVKTAEPGGVKRQLVHLCNAGSGVNRHLVHLGNAGRGEAGDGLSGLIPWFQALSKRLERVRVCSGDWTRVCGPTPTVGRGLTAVFLDPPYADTATRAPAIYAVDSLSVAHAVRDWAIEHGDDPRLRICLAGYDTEHSIPSSWECVPWKAHGGYGNQGHKAGRANKSREVLWFSPHCLKPESAAIEAA